jgi:hypothetical protein
MQNPHFLLDKPNKPISHKNFDICFSTYPYIHANNTFVDDTPYKNIFNGPYSAIFLESFDDLCGEDQYLLGSIFPYLENFHLFGYGVPTFVEHNPFGRINFIN